MILTDSSVWIDHLRKADATMTACLEIEEILIHPFVIGELALGSMPRYDQVINSLYELPRPVVATDLDVVTFIRNHRLMGIGISYVDAHLLASAKLSPETLLWTRNKRLKKVAEAMQIASALS